MPTTIKYLGILLLITWYPAFAQPKNDSVFSKATLSSLFPNQSSGYSLFIFLSPECPLCQNYSKSLNQLQEQYGGRIAFYGIIPGATYPTVEIDSFRQKYKISYRLWVDRSLRLSHYLLASATPEVIFLGPSQQLIYKGAIDNWYKALGKSSTRPTEHYLQDAIEHALKKEPSPIKRTTPVGCLINDF